ncbi:MAG: EAL domain-containing protein [Alphaproteobacteria bacterium]|nr:MAG: EAL domain-containing protein [Alphaproteobacteria bacterium]
MMNTAKTLAQVILVGAPDRTNRFRDMVRAGGGHWSTDELLQFMNMDEVVAAAKRVAPEPSLVVICAGNLTADIEQWFGSAGRMDHVVNVTVSDSRAVLEFAQQNGHPLVLNDAQLGPAAVSDALIMALEMQNLRAQRTKLQGLYDMAEDRFRDMADLYADWLWEIDSDLKLVFSSSRKRPASGASAGSLLTGCFLAEEKLRIEDDFAELARSPRPFHDRDYWSQDPYGSRICWNVSGMPVLDSGGNLKGFRGVARDVSSMKAATDQIYYLVNHDTLTGVMNRQRFQDEMVRTLRAAKREQRSGALVLLDIDRFAYVNQTYGHQVGDKLLIHIAQVLKDNVRTGDLVSRLDGDQFAIVLRDVRPEDVDGRLERLQSTLASRPMATENGSITLNVSGGVSLYPHDADSADTLLAMAIGALERAKVRGPHRFERHDPEQHTADVNNGQMEWVELLNECLTNHKTRLVLYYQPIVPLGGPAVKDGAEHYEVLVRLIDREGNLIVPGKFISTAEEFGLVSKIDALVTMRAIDMLQLWHSQGRKVHLSVNLSGKTFDDTAFTESLKTTLKAAQLPEKSLIFEITETALLRDLQLVKTFMTDMRALGAGFALDDCGVGYSSFNYIRQLELDFIKIDGSFVRNLHMNDDDQAFVKALADVAKQKNISTVAEMVEHEAAMIALRNMGIDFGQGFFFAPPSAELQSSTWNQKFLN